MFETCPCILGISLSVCLSFKFFSQSKPRFCNLVAGSQSSNRQSKFILQISLVGILRGQLCICSPVLFTFPLFLFGAGEMLTLLYLC